MIRVALLDDHQIVLDGLSRLVALEPDMCVIAACATGEALLAAIKAGQVDVAVLDLSLPGINGLDVLGRMQIEHFAVRTIVLTAATNEADVIRAIAAGTHGLVLKEAAPQTLIKAIRSVANGETALDSAFARRAVELVDRNATPQSSILSDLTPREIEIIRMIERGLRNRDIAELWGIAEGTVKVHLNKIYRKLMLDGRLALAVFAREHKDVLKEPNHHPKTTD